VKTYEGEPKLNEVLSDPIVLAVMKSDGVDASRFGAFLDGILRRNRRPTWSGHHASRLAALFEGAPVSSSDLLALRSRRIE